MMMSASVEALFLGAYAFATSGVTGRHGPTG
jgi:hypothetical protein